MGLANFHMAADDHTQVCPDAYDLKPVGTHDGKPSIRFKKIPKPADCIASTSTSIPEKKDDFEKFSKPVIRRGGVVKKWMEKLYLKNTTVEEVVTTKTLFASLLVEWGDTQPELDETVFVRDPKDKNEDALLMSDLADLEDNHAGVNGSEVNQCGEIVGQSADTKVEIAAIDLTEINVTFHVDTAPSSPKDPKRLDNTYSETVSPKDNQALGEDLAAQLIETSLDSIPYVE
ncbi:hypothetical protein LIER_32547 [Lithospermum erythrorhizon]|uniref:Uncharacterized protein n=1 Tax=Lithospermum erythrorhizon TaxID=34254 RepID=A0AAV3RV31_LITER